MGVECESADALVRKHFDGVIGRTMLQTALHSVAKFAVLQPNKTLGRSGSRFTCAGGYVKRARWLSNNLVSKPSGHRFARDPWPSAKPKALAMTSACSNSFGRSS